MSWPTFFLADLGCFGKASHDALLSWLGDLRLPELTSRARLSLHGLLFWTQVLAAPDPGLAPAAAAGQQLQPDAPRTMWMATANVLTLRRGRRRTGLTAQPAAS